MQGTRWAQASRRTAAAVAVCAVAASCALAGIGPAAAGARPSGRSLAHSAHVLAMIVRHSAHRVAGGHLMGVVTVRCCGRRVLDVYYRARPHRKVPWHGTYELKVRRRGSFLESVQVSFFPTPAKWAFGGEGAREGPRYSFAISSPTHGRGWRVTVDDSFFGCELRPATHCEGFSDELALQERQLGKRQFKALFRQALKIVRKARRHVPISSQDVVSVGVASRAARTSHAARARHAAAPWR